MSLDALISVDTATAHLAGALGVPCHMPVAFNPDWRWLLDRRDSPWYASLTLHRQQHAHDWEPALTSIAADLRAEFEERANG